VSTLSPLLALQAFRDAGKARRLTRGMVLPHSSQIP